MSNEINTISASEEELVVEGFGAVEIDAIGEIENITMGSAATAVSNLLNAKVWITTPQVKVVKAKTLSYQDLAPFVYVKIEYMGNTLLHPINVKKAEYDIGSIDFSDTEFEYNGTSQISSYKGELPIGLDGIRLEAIIEGGGTLVGEYTVTLSFFTESENYSVPDPIVRKLRIIPKTVELIWE